MSQKKRKLGYWGIEFLNGDETYFDSSLFENFIEYVKGLDSTQLLQRDPQNSKAIALDKIWTTSSQGRKLYEVRFKSCKYNHSPDYMSSRDGTERPTEKQLYEGDKELTHLCLRVDPDEAFCVIEERKSGVTLGAVIRYFNMLLRNYLLSQGNEMPIVLFASVVPSEDFMSALNSAEKITIAELFVQKDVMGSGFLDYLDVDASTREDVVMTVKAKPRQSFTKRAFQICIKLFSCHFCRPLFLRFVYITIETGANWENLSKLPKRSVKKLFSGKFRREWKKECVPTWDKIRLWTSNRHK